MAANTFRSFQALANAKAEEKAAQAEAMKFVVASGAQLTSGEPALIWVGADLGANALRLVSIRANLTEAAASVRFAQDLAEDGLEPVLGDETGYRPGEGRQRAKEARRLATTRAWVTALLSRGGRLGKGKAPRKAKVLLAEDGQEYERAAAHQLPFTRDGVKKAARLMGVFAGKVA